MHGQANCSNCDGMNVVDMNVDKSCHPLATKSSLHASLLFHHVDLLNLSTVQQPCNAKCHPSLAISLHPSPSRELHVKNGATYHKIYPTIVSDLALKTNKSWTLVQVGHDDKSQPLFMTTNKHVVNDCVGHHVLMHAPYKYVKSCLAHYMSAKSSSPSTTSAGILVPYRPNATYWK